MDSTFSWGVYKFWFNVLTFYSRNLWSPTKNKNKIKSRETDHGRYTVQNSQTKQLLVYFINSFIEKRFEPVYNS